HDHAGGAAGGGLGQERVAVEAMAADREERLADAERARVDRHAGDGDAEVAGHQRALGGAHDVLHAERRHTAHGRAWRARISRATARSSKGSVSAPTSW